MAIFREKIYSSEIKMACRDIADEYGYTVSFNYYDKPTKTNYSGDTKLGGLFENYLIQKESKKVSVII